MIERVATGATFQESLLDLLREKDERLATLEAIIRDHECKCDHGVSAALKE